MFKHFVLPIATLASLVPSLCLSGGYASIKVADLPQRIVAGRPVTVTFTVRDAAGLPLSNLKPVVIATRGELRVEAKARAVKRAPGGYAAEVALPGEGEWMLVVDSRYCHNTCVLRGVQVLAAATD